MPKYKCQNCFGVFYGCGAKLKCPKCGGKMKEITKEREKARDKSKGYIRFF